MRGVSLQIDILYVILFFLLVAIIILAFISMFGNKIKEGIEKGDIWQWIENMFKKGLRR